MRRNKGGGNISVLDIRNIEQDKIEAIFIASQKKAVVDLIRTRIAKFTANIFVV